MFASSPLKGCLYFGIFVAFFAAPNARRNLTAPSSYKSCPGKQLLCGKNICYDPAAQSCTELDKTVECMNVCGDQCYNPRFEQCFNSTLCQSSLACNQQCLQNNQLCSCNDLCYDSTTEQCINGTIQCINDCAGACYNSSSRQCLNGTLCKLSEQFCKVVCNRQSQYDYTSRYIQCYDPSYQLCFNNTLCDTFRVCNQQCLPDNQICVNNTTICNITGSYYNYQTNQIQLCDGVCYDTTIRQCVSRYITVNSTSTRSP
ncbi:hypothetical protein I4U23_004623 [Adineta vaga]|nr:hypothetical protein I4U23_004623 [Adineta vaga]